MSFCEEGLLLLSLRQNNNKIIMKVITFKNTLIELSFWAIFIIYYFVLQFIIYTYIYIYPYICVYFFLIKK
nr:MAG TPA: hypothetical protein [Caudoviricetes sp.]